MGCTPFLDSNRAALGPAEVEALRRAGIEPAHLDHLPHPAQRGLLRSDASLARVMPLRNFETGANELVVAAVAYWRGGYSPVPLRIHWNAKEARWVKGCAVQWRRWIECQP